ncbi:MAG: ABC transporter ATP-binding protein [Chitinophagaceae bacterium]|nr:ABC transporter ATP-binding protein [Chitinophagaceae bacterium]
MMDYMLKVDRLCKSYQSGARCLTVLHDVSFTVETGSVLAITGPSGSGKTTLLGLCAGLDQVTSGTIELNGLRLDNAGEEERASIRNRYIGYVFQNFQLLPTLTALENVMVPLELQGKRNIRPQAVELLEKVGLADRLHHYPVQLSGGEQQRVSIARAFSTHPRILFADEPTGNLDEETSSKIIPLLFELNREAGTTMVIVTHNADLAKSTQRIIRLKGGQIMEDKPTGDTTPVVQN